MARVRISKTPKALSGLEIKMRPGLYGTNGNRQFTLPNQVNSQRFSQQPVDVRDTLQPVAREGANLEAEKGETALVNIDGIPAHFKIGGKRHHSGGTPLNLPDNSFIFSDTAKMKIKDPVILAQFGMVPKKSGYTPAEIAKKYDINTFRKILADPNSEDVERKTAEMMIANYNMKLAKLALVQESTKGFPQGIPAVAMPYVMANEINPEELFETQGQEEQPDADMGVSRYGGNMVAQFNTKAYGGVQYTEDGLPMGQDGFWSNVGQGALAVLEAPQRGMMWGLTGTAGLLSGKGWTGEYEMPSQTLNRNFPGHPGLAFAADLLADPFMVSGIVKGVARAGLRKVIAKEAADFAIKNQGKNLAKYEATMAVLRNVAAKKAAKLKNVKNGTVDAAAATNKLFTELKTSTNAERVIKALNTSEKVMKSKKFNKLDNIADQANLVQKRLIKSTGRVAQKQAAVTAAKLPIAGAKAIGKGIAKAAPPVARVAKKIAKKTGELAEKAVEKVKDLNTPNVTPFIIPAIQTGEKVSAAIRYSNNNEVQKTKDAASIAEKKVAIQEKVNKLLAAENARKPVAKAKAKVKSYVQPTNETTADFIKRVQQEQTGKKFNLDEYQEINP